MERERRQLLPQISDIRFTVHFYSFDTTSGGSPAKYLRCTDPWYTGILLRRHSTCSPTSLSSNRVGSEGKERNREPQVSITCFPKLHVVSVLNIASNRLSACNHSPHRSIGSHCTYGHHMQVIDLQHIESFAVLPSWSPIWELQL